jgi:hypothetical protein
MNLVSQATYVNVGYFLALSGMLDGFYCFTGKLG